MGKKQKQAASHERERQKRLDAQKKRAEASKRSKNTHERSTSRAAQQVKYTGRDTKGLERYAVNSDSAWKLFKTFAPGFRKEVQARAGEYVIQEAGLVLSRALELIAEECSTVAEFNQKSHERSFEGFTGMYVEAVNQTDDLKVKQAILHASITLVSRFGSELYIDAETNYLKAGAKETFDMHVQQLVFGHAVVGNGFKSVKTKVDTPIPEDSDLEVVTKEVAWEQSLVERSARFTNIAIKLQPSDVRMVDAKDLKKAGAAFMTTVLEFDDDSADFEHFQKEITRENHHRYNSIYLKAVERASSREVRGIVLAARVELTKVDGEVVYIDAEENYLSHGEAEMLLMHKAPLLGMQVIDAFGQYR